MASTRYWTALHFRHVIFMMRQNWDKGRSTPGGSERIDREGCPTRSLPWGCFELASRPTVINFVHFDIILFFSMMT